MNDTTIWIFMSQLVDNISTKNAEDARYYLQVHNPSFKFSFEPPVDHLEPQVTLYTLVSRPKQFNDEKSYSIR